MVRCFLSILSPFVLFFKIACVFAGPGSLWDLAISDEAAFLARGLASLERSLARIDDLAEVNPSEAQSLLEQVATQFQELEDQLGVTRHLHDRPQFVASEQWKELTQSMQEMRKKLAERLSKSRLVLFDLNRSSYLNVQVRQTSYASSLSLSPMCLSLS